MIEVVINATKNSPELRFTDAKVQSDGLTWARLISAPAYNSQMRITGGTQTPTGDIAIDNGDGALTTYLDWRVIGAGVSVAKDDRIIFAGRVYTVSLGEIITLGVEA